MNPRIIQLGSIGIACIGAIMITVSYFSNQNTTNPVYQTSIGNYLFAGMIIQAVVLFLIQNYVEGKKRIEDKKLHHSELIAQNILKPVVGIKSILSVGVDYCEFWYVKTEKHYDPQKGEVVVQNHLPVEILEKQQSYKWFFDHHLKAKQYKKADDAWKNADSLRELYGKKRADFKTILGATIISEMSRAFPNFVAFEPQSSTSPESKPVSDNPKKYNIKKMKMYLENALKNPEQNFEKFIIDRLKNGVRTITATGMDIDGILYCPEENESELDVEKFYQVLNSIRNDKGIASKYQEYQTILKNIEENLDIFRKEIDAIIEKIDHQKPLEGKCEICK